MSTNMEKSHRTQISQKNIEEKSLKRASPLTDTIYIVKYELL